MGLRERLQQKARPTDECKVAVEDTRAAERELQEAAANLQLLSFAGDAESREAAQARFTAARAALEACFETVTFTAMDPDLFEQLSESEEHAPREGHPLDDAWNVDTFPRAVFFECAPDVFSREEWEDWLRAQVNDGERIRLYNTAVNANLRVLDPSVPKGLTEILS